MPLRPCVLRRAFLVSLQVLQMKVFEFGLSELDFSVTFFDCTTYYFLRDFDMLGDARSTVWMHIETQSVVTPGVYHRENTNDRPTVDTSRKCF